MAAVNAGMGWGADSPVRRGWEAFEAVFAPAYVVARECARYRWFWDERTIWLGTHGELMGTPLYEERRAIRREMTGRWNELRAAFAWQAELVLDQAEVLGRDCFPAIRAEYGVDYCGTTRRAIDAYYHQWRELLVWNPEPCPF